MQYGTKYPKLISQSEKHYKRYLYFALSAKTIKLLGQRNPQAYNGTKLFVVVQQHLHYYKRDRYASFSAVKQCAQNGGSFLVAFEPTHAAQRVRGKLASLRFRDE